jgi:anti-anti-sigma factor
MPESSVPEAVVLVIGPFAGVEVARWRALIDEAVAISPHRLVVDLTMTPCLDAAAIAVLLAAHRAMVHAGGLLTLRGPIAAVQRVLRLAGVEQVFDVADTGRADVPQQ